MLDISARLIKDLVLLEIPFEIIEHEEITNVEEGVRLLNFPKEKILKTIGFCANNKHIFVVIQGQKRIDYKKLGQAVGIERKSLKMLSSEVIEDQLGYQIGGLSPLHHNLPISVFVDSGIYGLDIVYCGVGVRNKTLKISPQNLVLASEATLAYITK